MVSVFSCIEIARTGPDSFLVKDLEKRQNRFRTGVLKPLPPHHIKMDDGTTLTMRPTGTGLFSAISGKGIQNGMSEEDIPGGLVDTPPTEDPTKPSFGMAGVSKPA